MSHIDLILWGNTKAAIATMLGTNPPANPLYTGQTYTDPITGAVTYIMRPGVDYCWWAGDGKLMTAKPVMDGMTVVTPATYLTGFVMLMRIHTVMYEATKLTPAQGETEQWHRSSIAKYIKDNGTLGSSASGALPYYALSGIRIYRPTDVEAWLAARDLPSHMWVGGNSY